MMSAGHSLQTDNAQMARALAADDLMHHVVAKMFTTNSTR
jgi:hypothetical protein